MGAPLTKAMQAQLHPWGSHFPDKVTATRLIVSGRLKLSVVQTEWEAQTERCLAHDTRLLFLNSHEHVHMPLFVHSYTRIQWSALRCRQQRSNA